MCQNRAYSWRCNSIIRPALNECINNQWSIIIWIQGPLNFKQNLIQILKILKQHDYKFPYPLNGSQNIIDLYDNEQYTILMLLPTTYLRGSFLYSIVPGGSVVGVRVLFMATVTLFGPCTSYLVNSTSNGRCPPKCCITSCPFTHCNESRHCNLLYTNT